MKVPALRDSLSWDTNQCVCDITTISFSSNHSFPWPNHCRAWAVCCFGYGQGNVWSLVRTLPAFWSQCHFAGRDSDPVEILKCWHRLNFGADSAVQKDVDMKNTKEAVFKSPNALRISAGCASSCYKPGRVPSIALKTELLRSIWPQAKTMKFCLFCWNMEPTQIYGEVLL